MARDKALLTLRDSRIRADYNRLKATEVLVKNRDATTAIRLTYAQIMHTLSNSHCLSVRTLEAIVAATEPQMAPLTKRAASPQATA